MSRFRRDDISRESSRKRDETLRFPACIDCEQAYLDGIVFKELFSRELDQWHIGIIHGKCALLDKITEICIAVVVDVTAIYRELKFKHVFVASNRCYGNGIE